MFRKRFALCFELLDMLAAVFNGLLQLAFAELVGLNLLWLQLLGQLDLGKLDQLTAEQSVLTPDLTYGKGGETLRPSCVLSRMVRTA